jgi:hypothetical protein
MTLVPPLRRTLVDPLERPLGGGLPWDGIGGGAPAFAISQLGTVPRWDGTFYGVSGANVGISGAGAWSIQALCSLDATTNAFRMIAQIGNDTSLLGAFIGALNLPSAGGYALGAHYYTTPFGTQSRINPVASQWYHLTATYDGTTLRVYVDGVLCATRAATLNITDNTLIVNGNRAHSNFFWDGPACRIGIWSRELTAAEVLASAIDPRVAETQSPLRYYRCDEGSGSTLVDRGSAGDNVTITGTPVWVAASVGGATYHRIRECYPIGDSITAGTTNFPGSWRKNGWGLWTRKANPVGERTATVGATPGYGIYNGGLSGDTIAQAGARLAGAWTGSDFTIGSAGDPGAGNRGEIEDTAVRGNGQGSGGADGVVLVSWLGTNDAIAGAVDVDAYALWLKRMWNVQRVAGTARRILVVTPVPNADDPTADGHIDTMVAALPAMVASLNSAGYPATLVDVHTGWDDGTMFDTDNIHPDDTGYAYAASLIMPAIEAA